VWQEALAAARGLGDDRDWTWALGALTTQLAAYSAGDATLLWNTTIRSLSTHGRPALLNDLSTLMPWLAVLASPEELAEVAQAVVDVARCWP
jgi:hypothetical protein